MPICDFCKQSVLNRQIIYNGKRVVVLYPRSPVIREHLMIVPIRHVADLRELTKEELLDCADLVNRIVTAFEKARNASGYNLFANVGRKAGQHIPHFHWHLFIRFDDERISPYKIMNNSELKEKLTAKEWEKRKNSFCSLLS